MGSLKDFLIKNQYNYLYEENKENKIIKPTTLKEQIEFKKRNIDIIENNIIGINILSEKINDEDKTKVNGMKKLIKATKFFIQKTNPFYSEDFIKIQKISNELKKYYNYEINKKLTKGQEEKLKLIKEDCRNLMIKISRENTLLYKLKNEYEIIKKGNAEAWNCIYITSGIGFAAGMIPIPFADLPILYSVYSGLIMKIANCYNIKSNEISKTTFAKLIFGLSVDVQSSGKILGNGVGMAAGREIGSELVYDIGEEQVINWGKSGLHIVEKGGNVNIGKEAEKLLVKNESKFKDLLMYIYNLIPSFKSGVEKGIENGGQQLGKNLEDILVKNTVNLSKEVVEEASQNFGQIYAEKITFNASKHINYLKNLSPKILPVIGSLIGGILDLYSTYNIGKNAINYFEEYIKKTIGCEFMLRRKEEYEKIFRTLDIIANDDFENLKPNIID